MHNLSPFCNVPSRAVCYTSMHDRLAKVHSQHSPNNIDICKTSVHAVNLWQMFCNAGSHSPRSGSQCPVQTVAHNCVKGQLCYVDWCFAENGTPPAPKGAHDVSESVDQHQVLVGLEKIEQRNKRRLTEASSVRVSSSTLNSAGPSRTGVQTMILHILGNLPVRRRDTTLPNADALKSEKQQILTHLIIVPLLATPVLLSPFQPGLYHDLSVHLLQFLPHGAGVHQAGHQVP